jgi:integral membrane sensor domain MASE1
VATSGSARWTWLVALTAAYVLTGKLGLLFASVHASATAVWPPTGIALAALLILGVRVWPAVAAGAFLVNVTTAGTVATSLGIALGNTLEALVGAWLVGRLAYGRGAFERPRRIFAFAAAVAPGAAIAATTGVTSLVLGGVAPRADVGAIWITWALGDITGALIIAPLLILWTADHRSLALRAQPFEALVLLLGLVGTALVAFGGLAPAAGATTRSRSWRSCPAVSRFFGAAGMRPRWCSWRWRWAVRCVGSGRSRPCRPIAASQSPWPRWP